MSPTAQDRLGMEQEEIMNLDPADLEEILEEILNLEPAVLEQQQEDDVDSQTNTHVLQDFVARKKGKGLGRGARSDKRGSLLCL